MSVPVVAAITYHGALHVHSRRSRANHRTKMAASRPKERRRFALAHYFILKKLHTPDRNLHIPLMPVPLLYASLAEIFPDRKRKDFDPGQQDRSHLFLRVS